MPSTPLSQITIGQAIMGSIATSAATGLMGSLFAPDAGGGGDVSVAEAPEPPPTSDREELTHEAERRGARARGTRAQTTTLFDSDLLGA